MKRALILLPLVLFIGCNCGGRVAPVHLSVEAGPRSLDFGVLAPGDSLRQTLTLTAHGADLHVARIALRDDARGSFSVGAGPELLTAELPAELGVTYAPRAEAAEAASLVVSFEDGLDDLVVPLLGRAVRGAQADAGPTDAGPVDAGTDAGPVDAGTDAGLLDGGVDAGMNAADSGMDAGVDAGVDAGADAGSADAGSFDAGLVVFDGGFCPGNQGFGHTRWPGAGAANLVELHWQGTDYAAFFYGRESWYLRVDAVGQEQPATLQQVTPDLSSASLFVRAARGPTSWGVVYADDRAGLNGRTCYFARVDLTGAVIAGSEISLGPSSDVSCNIAFNPLDSEWGVTWGSNNTTRFERLSSAGARIAGSQLTLSTTSYVARLGMSRSLIWSGSRWVVTWAEPSAIKLVEIDRLGALQTSSLTTVSTGTCFDPAVAVAPGQYGVAWQQNGEVRFARVNEGGGLVAGSNRVLNASAGTASSADVVWDGTVFFVAFTQQPVSTPGMGQRVAIATVDAAGQATPGRVVTCGGSGDDFFPRVTWNGALHAVAYSRQYAPAGTVTQEGRVLLVP